LKEECQWVILKVLLKAKILEFKKDSNWDLKMDGNLVLMMGLRMVLGKYIKRLKKKE